LESFKYATTVRYMFSRGELRLQRLGRVSNVSPSRNIIVKTENPPKIGSEVVDENLNVIGRVFDIIGPVSAPYTLIKPNVKEPSKLLDKPVYLLLSKTKRSKN
jgi:RNA-binding protein